jgi:hypothetical protein
MTLVAMHFALMEALQHPIALLSSNGGTVLIFSLVRVEWHIVLLRTMMSGIA